ncbi:hypothetical protein H4A24_06490 [Staphylococcus schleiferi]|uniref:hypothetical protein n=1 Tax=Staphylococcus schleiferi TaxID=1295 RepID=UPI001887FC5F|nr:hypothetical protein [Staphylococcus schleiferi]MBF1993135.1 hypothetical protein [Staphylococcus schleiferi]MBF2038607.1 hypothetical protein [Staphylococcus schleiferi]MBF2100504.1 hypothetical protein [Staphylococcus schleiferi]MBF2102867.1 hypothetical protein [Staphylococcus schleiferi]MBF2104888.1 hypothetical protein [Staphylococcus schleiferi]
MTEEEKIKRSRFKRNVIAFLFKYGRTALYLLMMTVLMIGAFSLYLYMFFKYH